MIVSETMRDWQKEKQTKKETDRGNTSSLLRNKERKMVPKI